MRTLEETLKIAPSLSLVEQGLIDQPCAPLLCINGKNDDQRPISDFYLLAEHGSPKELRIITGAGHMGRKTGQPNDEVVTIVTQWLKQKLAGGTNGTHRDHHEKGRSGAGEPENL